MLSTQIYNRYPKFQPKITQSKGKVFNIFLNEVTVLAVLRLTVSESLVEGAATAKALDPHFVRKRGTVNIFVLENLSNSDF